MERRGEPSERGDINRDAQQGNELTAESQALDAAIATERERQADPPLTREDALERMQDELVPLMEAVQTRGAIADKPTYDGMKWWQRTLLRIRDRVQDLAKSLTQTFGYYWQGRTGRDGPPRDHGPDEEGLDR